MVSLSTETTDECLRHPALAEKEEMGGGVNGKELVIKREVWVRRNALGGTVPFSIGRLARSGRRMCISAG